MIVMKYMMLCSFRYPEQHLEQRLDLDLRAPACTCCIGLYIPKGVTVVSNNWNTIYDVLEKWDEKNDKVSFPEFLKDHLSFLGKSNYLDALKDYEEAISYSLKRSTIMLKRLPHESRINNYNKSILLAWRANMDIQYILDAYACIVYIINYITKKECNMARAVNKAEKLLNSPLLKKAVRDPSTDSDILNKNDESIGKTDDSKT